MRQWDSSGRGHWGYRLTHRATEMLNVAEVADISVLIMAVAKMSGTRHQPRERAGARPRDISDIFEIPWSMVVRTRHW